MNDDPYPHLTQQRADLINWLLEATDLIKKCDLDWLSSTDEREKLRLDQYLFEIKNRIDARQKELEQLDEKIGDFRKKREQETK